MYKTMASNIFHNDTLFTRIKTALLAILLFMANLQAFAQIFSCECESGQMLWYEVVDEESHKVKLFRYTGDCTGDLVIPEAVANNGVSYTVTEIAPYTFYLCESLNGKLFLPNSLSSIGASAFNGCTNINSELILPNALAYIGEKAFFNCHNLKGSLVIPNSVTTISAKCFGFAGFDGTLTLSDSVTSIGEWAFAYCNFTGSLAIPNSVTHIADVAFDACESFNGTLSIPASLTEISSMSFRWCPNFEAIIVDSANPRYHSENNAIIEKDTKILVFGCKNTVIPNDITKIGDYAFARCIGFSGKLVLPESVTEIGYGAFNNSGVAGSLTFSDNVTKIDHAAFGECASLSDTLTIGCSVAEIGQDAFSNLSGQTFSVIVLKATTPPSICYRSFNGDVPLHVPCGTLGIYLNSDWLEYFPEIIEDCEDLNDISYSLALRPNPTSSYTIIDGADVNVVEIYDINGQIVKAVSGNQIDLSTLAQGVYFLKVETTDGNIKMFKAIKR